jgi:Fe-S-cluster containining protein
MIDNQEILPFACKLTGKCCHSNEVPLNSRDIFQIAKSLNVKVKELFIDKIITYRIVTSSYWMEPILNTREIFICPFLIQENDSKFVCGIYDARPYACRLFPLKFDPDLSIYLRNEKSEMRCIECISPDTGITLQDYIQASGVELISEFYKDYRFFIDEIIRRGYNIFDIKKRKEKQNKFFRIQALLYETFPKNEEPVLPWEEIKETVLSIMSED